MDNYELISQKLYGIGQAEFQKVCEYYLEKIYNGEIQAPGSVEDKNKTRPGKPDIYLRLKDGKYIFAEATTHDDQDKAGFAKKLKNDIAGCLGFEAIGIAAAQVKRIVLCSNGTILPALREELECLVRAAGLELDVISLIKLANYFYNVDKRYARDTFGIPFDTGHVLNKHDFLELYHRKDIASPLDNPLNGRTEELKVLSQALNEQDVVMLTGAAGVGKSRLALQLIDDFIAENAAYTPYYVFSKPGSITDDLLSYLQAGKSYLLFIDDAFRQQENLLAITSMALESDLRLKLVLTVRDYAKDDVVALIKWKKPAVFYIRKLQNEVIEQILYHPPFEVANHQIRHRIVEISGGNPRLAIMAADATRQNPDPAILKDVSNIYDAYFESIIADNHIMNDELFIKSMGVVSFFQSIDLDEQESVDILASFGISIPEFSRVLAKMEDLELVSVKFTTVVKIADQVLGTYFFYTAFFKKELLSLDTLLNKFFGKYLWRIKDTFLPAISTFGTERIVGDEPRYLLNYLRLVQGYTSDCVQFFEIFGPYIPQKLFVFVAEQIAITETEAGDFEFLNTYQNNSPFENDAVLRLLEPFYQGNNEHFLTALGLALQYIHKQKSLLDKLVHQFKNNLHANGDDRSNDFKKLNDAYTYLFTKLNKGIAYKALFYTTMRQALLSPAFSHDLYEIGENGYFLNTNFAALRNRFFEDLAERYATDQEMIYDLLLNYIKPIGQGTHVYLEADQPYLAQLIQQCLSPQKFDDCYFVQNYCNLLSDKEIPLIHSLQQQRRRFTNKDYRCFNVLTLERNKNRKAFGYYSSYAQDWIVRKKYIAAHFKVDNLADFMAIMAAVKVYLDFKYWYNKSIMTGFLLLLEQIFENDNALGFQVLEYYIKENNPVSLNPIRLFNGIFHLGNGNEEKLYQLLTENDFKGKQAWLENYFEYLPAEYVTKRAIKRLLQCFATPSNRYKCHLQYFEKYEEKVPGTIMELTKLLKAKHQQDPAYHYELQFEFFSHYPYLRETDFILAKSLYIEQEDIDPSFDPRADDLFFLMEKDLHFFVEYIDFRLVKYETHFTSPNKLLTKIWNVKGADQLVYDTLIKLSGASVFSIGLDSFCEKLFMHVKDEQQILALKVLEKLINNHPSDSRILNTVWDISRNYLKDFYTVLIQKWLQLNDDFELFKKMDWTNNHYEYTGQTPVWGDFKAAELEKIYQAVSELPDQERYVRHKDLLLDDMNIEKRSANWERKRIYRGLW